MRKRTLFQRMISIALLAGSFASFADEIPADSGQHLNESFPLLALPLEEPPINAPRSQLQSAEGQRRWKELKIQILRDSQSRISPEFSIPEGLWERTWFWFDVYTRYGEAHHIIHHVRYPWIIYKIYDTTQTLVNSGGPLWLRRDRAGKLANKEADNIRLALRRLARKKDYSRLTGLEKYLFDRLAIVPGPRRAIFADAARNVRSQLGQKDFFMRGLVNSSKYLPLMEAEFASRGLPMELTRLPFVESSFNEDARSKVGASGIWQIMPATGRAYMTVNDTIDERNSPLKATKTASILLRSYVRALGQWPLAITAYNNGIGNIQIAMRQAKSRDLSQIIARYHRGDFKFASSNFFTCFLAVLYAEKYHDVIFRNVEREPLLERSIVQIGRTVRARQLPMLTGVPKEDLLRYNLDLQKAFRKNAIVPRGFQIFVPAGSRLTIERRALVEPGLHSRAG